MQFFFSPVGSYALCLLGVLLGRAWSRRSATRSPLGPVPKPTDNLLPELSNLAARDHADIGDGEQVQQCLSYRI